MYVKPWNSAISIIRRSKLNINNEKLGAGMMLCGGGEAGGFADVLGGDFLADFLEEGFGECHAHVLDGHGGERRAGAGEVEEDGVWTWFVG